MPTNNATKNENVSRNVSITAEITRQHYENSVMQRMQGRSGAYTPNGSKGIALEIMRVDKINAQNFLNPDVKAVLTKQANASQVDAIIMNGNKVSGRMQYKDVLSDTGVRNTVKRVQNGDYHAVKLYGTTESTQKFNRAAEKMGINKRMIDTGISSNTTQRIGDKFTGQIPKISSVGDAMKQSSKISAGITAGIEIVKSIDNGDSFSECAGNVAKKVSQNVTSTAASVVAAETVMTVLAPFGPFISGGGALVTTLIVNDAVSEATENFFEDLGREISCGVDRIGDTVSEIGAQVGCLFGALFGF